MSLLCDDPRECARRTRRTFRLQMQTSVQKSGEEIKRCISSMGLEVMDGVGVKAKAAFCFAFYLIFTKKAGEIKSEKVFMEKLKKMFCVQISVSLLKPRKCNKNEHAQASSTRSVRPVGAFISGCGRKLKIQLFCSLPLSCFASVKSRFFFVLLREKEMQWGPRN